MKAIIENKLYDTEKSEKIFDYLRNEPQPVFFRLLSSVQFPGLI